MAQDEGKRMPTLLPKEFSTKTFFAQKSKPNQKSDYIGVSQPFLFLIYRRN
jgi:hypothetical protein